jgi:hypothetical protein
MLWDDFILTHAVTLVICLFAVHIFKSKGHFRIASTVLLFALIIALSFYLRHEVIFGLGMGFSLSVLIFVFFKFRDRIRETPIAQKILAGGIALIIMLPFLLSPLPCFLQSGFGYEVCSGKIVLRNYFLTRDIIDVRSSDILITSDEGWKPKWRINGYAEFDTQMGYYSLKNGKKAVVFMNGYYNKILVINSSGKYYVIIHPGVERVCEVVNCSVVKT